MKAKDTTHSYTGWRDRLTHQQQKQLARIEQRAAQSDAPVLTDDQALLLALAKILDEGGETTEYIRDLHDGE